MCRVVLVRFLSNVAILQAALKRAVAHSVGKPLNELVNAAAVVGDFDERAISEDGRDLQAAANRWNHLGVAVTDRESATG